jgi:hypothetical protein
MQGLVVAWIAGPLESPRGKPMNAIKCFRFLLALFAANLLLVQGAAAAGIAFITDIRGEATIGANKLALLAEVGKGARIACLKDCRVGVMYLVSGKEFTLTGPGDFLIGDAEIAAKIGPPPKVRDTDWKVSAQTVSQAVHSSNASIRMRSVGAAAGEEAKTKDNDALPAERLLYPVQTSVASLQPAFRWAAGTSRGPFDFELKLAGVPGKVVYKTRLSETAVKLPAAVKLQPDFEYTWSVKMGGAGKGAEVGSGSFKTLAASSLELAQKRKPGEKSEFSDWLLYGLTLKELGAAQDAAEVFGKLSRERPDVAELAMMAKS